MGLRPAHKADLALLAMSAIWGCTFVVVKRALGDASPAAFLSLRFGLAALVLGWVFRRSISPFRRESALAGILLGALLGSGFILQTWGLLYTTATRSAFLTGLSVVGVPIMAAAMRLRGLNAANLLGAAIALAGLYLLTHSSPARESGDSGPGGFGRGEILAILCSVAFAAHIVGVDIFGRRHDTRALVFYQVAAAALIFVPIALFAERARVTFTPALIGALLLTGIVGTALAFSVQNTMQPKTTPTRAAIIFASEPVFAAATSFAVEGERLTAEGLAGAALILAGMLTSELSPVRESRRTV